MQPIVEGPLAHMVLIQAYGYDVLPLLLSLDSLALLHVNPIPIPYIPSKLPYAQLRKQLRLLLEDAPEHEEANPSDISYVYSGYAPLSVRLVQCVAQMNGVLASFGGAGGDTGTSFGAVAGAGSGGGGATSSSADGRSGKNANWGVKAHPIVGWKGFEDVVATIPGKTVDISQRGVRGSGGGVSSGPSSASYTFLFSNLGPMLTCSCFGQFYRKIRAQRLWSFSWVAVPLRRLQLFDGWENIPEVRPPVIGLRFSAH